ncbi:Oidioi.mRNA.OKI2018_I69.PAR.g9350.t1.cds [Oikopleura dioica]|uniref:Oidioi.mRNA.OKI2018_I69.PAR.g9345.t1.cds n=1 Tax=Oikopleura dioica TaxID=34765 RepID=A0ABN7RK57_OIKDI|nr:Oidioi.mRNA.OKI2018_I69.PAR.g9345.t1.cds [Oikopleura dioica]CAG5079746.1 Oidioi.mRNA.OKI2018_I69.PAR.g9350.t1.cds [Oikopleura dioica]
MKLSVSILLSYSSAQRCEDFTLGQRCQSSCDGDFYNCKDACDNGDFSCVTRCQAEFLDCQSACPCGANCPQGCSTNDACGANKFCSYTSILVLNHKQHFRDQALAINTLDDSVSEIVFDYGLSDIEDACSVIFRGESYFLGGYQRTRQVAKIGGNGCEIEILDDRLSVGHQDGVFGSCSVFNQQVALCFAVENEDSKTCHSWEPGMRQSQLPTANESHDWSEMITFRGSLFTVGGCLEPTYAGYGSKIFDKN